MILYKTELIQFEKWGSVKAAPFFVR